MRGLVIDAARQPETLPYYRRVVDFCHDWRVNTILLRLTDDQGSAFRFSSHPGLVTHRHALSASDCRELCRYALRRGVDMVPEIESFGHALYITRAAGYEHLGDTNPRGTPGFSGLIPSPDSLALIRDLYREVAEVFPSRLLHGGCDEVNWGGSEFSRKLLETKSRAEVWAGYINALDGFCRELGKELIVWGDFVLHKEPEILPRLSKRVIVMDWQYYVTDARPLVEDAKKVIAQGLRVIGAPALVSCEWGPRVGEKTLNNVEAYADAYAGIDSAACLGVMVTNWMPGRYLPRAQWDSFAYAAVAMESGSAAARSSALKKFVERFYGARWNQRWQQMFESIYAEAPVRRCARWPGLPLLAPWASDEEVRAAIAAGSVKAEFAPLVASIRELRGEVLRNAEDFDCFLLTAEYLDQLYWRNQSLLEAIGAEAAVRATRLREIAARDQALMAKLDEDWKATRYADDPGRHAATLWLLRPDQLVYQFDRATDYSHALALAPERLAAIAALTGK